jgi:hypothetical protein
LIIKKSPLASDLSGAEGGFRGFLKEGNFDTPFVFSN